MKYLTFIRHPRVGGEPEQSHQNYDKSWIPAYAGMTTRRVSNILRISTQKSEGYAR